MNRRQLLALPAVLAVAACTPGGTTPTPSTSGLPTTPLSSTPSATPTPVAKLTDAGMARKAVTALVTAAGANPVIKVDLTDSTAQLAVLIDGKVKTYAWTEGVTSEVDSDIEYVGQTSFDPAQFAFDDLNHIFGIAGALSGSTSNQQLHIVDYNNGEVLMTVTTRPESRPVFFRSDATPIHELDFTSESGIDEGLTDAIGDRTQLVAIGYDKTQGLWADAPHSTDVGVMVRRIRPAKLPAYVTNRKEDPPDKLFSPVDVQPAPLAKLMKELPTKLGKEPDVSITWSISMVHGGTAPTITLDVGGQKVITDLEGRDITSTIEG